MLSSFSAHFPSLKSYVHFSDLGVEIALSHCNVEKRWFFSGKSTTAIHDLWEDVMARWIQDVRRPLFWHDCVSSISAAVSHQYYTALYYIVLIDPCRSRVTGVRSGYSVHQQIPSRENSLSCTRQVIHVIAGWGKTKGAMHDFVSLSLSNVQCSEQLPAGYMHYRRFHSFIHSWQSSCINLRCRILVGTSYDIP